MAFERRILTTYDASTAGFDRGTRRVSDQLARLDRTTETRLRSIDQRFERAGRAALRLGAALVGLGAGLGVAAIRNYAEAWRQAGRQLTSAGEAIDGNREKLARLAVRVRGDFTATGGAVTRFARVTGDGIDASIRRVETLQKLLAIGGAAPTERASATLQLTQGLRAGQLGGEELRAIREAAPVEFLDALAARAGGTRAELKKLGADGKLTAEVIKGALDDLATTADRDFAKLAVTGTEAAEVLGTGFSVFFGRIDEQIGATENLNRFLADVGTFLSEDAEAAATFAKALEVAAVAAGVLAGGRGLQAVTRALIDGAAARKASAAATAAEVISTQKEVQARRLALATLQRTIAQQAVSEKGIKNLAVANRQLATANAAVTAAEVRATAATNAHAIAQGRLSVATRLTTGALNTLKAAFVFFGGIPGLILGAVTAALLLTDAFEDQADRLDAVEGKLGEVESGISRVRSLEQDLKNDTEALKGANERLTIAIEAQSTAAEDTARLEIDAINRRIAKNRELKGEYEVLLRAQLAIVQGQLAVERTSFQRRFGGSGLTREDLLDETATSDESSDFLARRRDAGNAARRAAIVAAQDAGETLSESDQKFLETSAKLAELEIQARSTRDALDRLGEPVEVATTTGGAGGGGGGGAASKAEKDLLQELIDTSEQRQSQLIDEAVLLRANAEEVLFLEEKQRLLNFATEKELELTPAVLTLIDDLARSYANTASEVDDLRAAKELINQVTERELTTTERLRQSQERIKALLPEIIELVGDEARAHEIVAEAIKESNSEIAANDPLVKLTNDLLGVISTAEDFDDILKRILLKLIEIGAQEALGALAGGGGSSGGGSILGGFIQSFVGGLFTGGGSTAGLTSDQIRISQFHSGGVVGRDGTPRMVSSSVFAGAPRMHEGGIAGLRPGEVPAILERGEIVVPNNIGAASGGSTVIVGDTNITITEPGMTEQQLQRRLAQEREKTIREIVDMNNRNPNILHT